MYRRVRGRKRMATPLFQRRRGRLQFGLIAPVASPPALCPEPAPANCAAIRAITVFDSAVSNPCTAAIGKLMGRLRTQLPRRRLVSQYEGQVLDRRQNGAMTKLATYPPPHEVD